MKLIFIRHGDPDYSIDSLTEKGWREAELLADRIEKWDVTDFYCSPLGRAKATAKPYFERSGREAAICGWLREFPGFVVKEDGGKRIPWDLLPSHFTGIDDYFSSDKWLDTPLMSSGDVRDRYRDVTEGIDGILLSHGYRREGRYYRVERENRDTLVFFCHLGVMCAILSHLVNIPPVVIWQGFFVAPTSVTIVHTEEREEGVAYFRCACVGDVSHLNAAGEPVSFSGRFCETFHSDERH